jgi:hypothetical protein
MKILACYIVWNEEEFLPLSMRSVSELVDGYVVVDGNLKGWAEDKPNLSTDRTVEKARQFDNVKVIQTDAPMSECDKRELYLKEEADWYLTIDAPDIMFGDIKRLRYELQNSFPHYGVDGHIYASLQDFSVKLSQVRCILHHKDSGYHFGEHHWNTLDKQGRYMNGNGVRIDYVNIVSLRELRTKERIAQKDAYLQYRVLHPEERF